MTPDERAALRQDVLAVIATAFDDPAWTNGKTADAVLALTDKALDAETARADAVEDSLGGMVEWLAEVIVDTRDALRVGGCDEHVLTAEQLGALEAATRILARERNANPSRFDRMKAERDEARAEVKRLLAKYEPTPEQMADVEQRIQRLMDDVVEDPRDAALARVRALHTDTLPPLSPYCPACNDVAPCPTIRAIDGGAS